MHVPLELGQDFVLAVLELLLRVASRKEKEKKNESVRARRSRRVGGTLMVPKSMGSLMMSK